MVNGRGDMLACELREHGHHLAIIKLTGGYSEDTWANFTDAYKSFVLRRRSRFVMVFDLSEWSWPAMDVVLGIALKMKDLSSDLRWWSGVVMQAVVVVSGSEALASLVQTLVDTFKLTSPMYCVATNAEGLLVAQGLVALIEHDVPKYVASLGDRARAGGVRWCDIHPSAALAIFVAGMLRMGLRIPRRPCMTTDVKKK